jgi:membrane associated rhomboid family serine protease
MFLPLSDDDRKLHRVTWLTNVFIVVNLVVFVLQLLYPDITTRYSAVPKEIVTGQDLVGTSVVPGPDGEPIEIPQGPGPKPIYLTLFTSMFMHGGWLHLAGNMLFLWIFGNNVEHRFGTKRFLAFYLGSGLAAGLAHALIDPTSEVPMLGASGAIAGVLGAYLVLFPKNTVRVLVIFWIFSIPAFVVIGLWIASQLIGGAGMLADMVNHQLPAEGISYGAHVGGIVAGIILGLLFRIRMPEEPENVFTRRFPPPLPKMD